MAIDAGAEDVRVEGDYVEVITGPTDLDKVRRALVDAGVKITSAELSMVPKNSVPLDEKHAGSTLRLLDVIEELEDVQKVYSNADFPESVAHGVRGGLGPHRPPDASLRARHHPRHRPRPYSHRLRRHRRRRLDAPLRRRSAPSPRRPGPRTPRS